MIDRSFVYRLPKSKELMLYDFYMLSFIDRSPDSRSNCWSSYLERNDFELRIVSELIIHVKDKLLTGLKKSMLTDVFEALRGEFDHLSDQTSLGRDDIKTTLIQAKKLKQQRKYYEVVCLYKKYFSKRGWNKSYGGKAWARIANGWLKLHDCSGDERYIWIDHIYDLEHNTDTVFDKIEDYYIHSRLREGGEKWLKKALDMKARLTNPWALHVFCSEAMQTLSERALILKGYRKDQLHAVTSDVINIAKERKFFTSIIDGDVAAAEKYFQTDLVLNYDFARNLYHIAKNKNTFNYILDRYVLLTKNKNNNVVDVLKPLIADCCSKGNKSIIVMIKNKLDCDEIDTHIIDGSIYEYRLDIFKLVKDPDLKIVREALYSKFYNVEDRKNVDGIKFLIDVIELTKLNIDDGKFLQILSSNYYLRKEKLHVLADYFISKGANVIAYFSYLIKDKHLGNRELFYYLIKKPDIQKLLSKSMLEKLSELYCNYRGLRSLNYTKMSRRELIEFLVNQKDKRR